MLPKHHAVFSWRILSAIMTTGLVVLFLAPCFVPTRKVALPGAYVLKPISNSRPLLLTRSGGDSHRGPKGTIHLAVHAPSGVTVDLRPDGSFAVEGLDAVTGDVDKLGEETWASIYRGSGLLPEEIAELASMLPALGAGTAIDVATSDLKHFRAEPLLVLDDRYMFWVACLGYLLIAGSCIAGGVWLVRANRSERGG